MIAKPKRIQLSRAKGWRKPEGAIVVSRPSKWGNPFRFGDPFYGLVQEPGIGGDRPWDYEGRISAPGIRHDFHYSDGRIVECHVRLATRAECVEMYRLALIRQPTASMRMANPSKNGCLVGPTVADAIAELRGHDLCCLCPTDQVCHADVLLELNNGGAA